MPNNPQPNQQQVHRQAQPVQQVAPVQQVQQAAPQHQMQHLLHIQQPFYAQPHVTNPALIQPTQYMQTHDLTRIRTAVEQQMPQAYALVDNIRAQQNPAQRVTPLHHSRGTQLMANGQASVLEFDMAGSSFTQFRSDYMGIKGKGNSLRDYMKINRTGINKFLMWLPVLATRRKREAKHRAEQQLNQLMQNQLQWDNLTPDEQYNIQVLCRWRTHVGRSQRININGNMEKRKHIRKVVLGRKTRITMAGPQALFGASNRGEYSIENLRQYMLTMGQDYLTNTFSQWANGAPPHDVWLRIRGHSRGAVASAEGAMMIKYWIRENFPQYEQYVKFDLTQFDPVPGTGSYADHARVDLLQDNREQLRQRMLALGDAAETTVVYSLRTEHSVFFTPQQVQNSKRLILTPYSHGVSLGESERVQNGQNQQVHRPAFTDAATGEAYRSGSFNELPEGVYIVDESRTLVRVQNAAQWDQMRQMIVQGNAQADRSAVIDQMVHTWFTTHH